MKSGGSTKKSDRYPTLSPWVLILLTAPLPLLLLGYVGYQWHSKTRSLGMVEEQFLDRQNTVLAYDATRIAERVSELLDQAAIDVRALALFPNAKAREQFLLEQSYSVLGGGVKRNSSDFPMPLPALRYNRALVLNLRDSTFEWYWEADAKAPRLSSIAECQTAKVCDRNLLESAAKLPSGENLYGKALRTYTPKGTAPNDSRAGLSVAFRTENKIFLIALDYRHFWHLLSVPSFPYASKRDWLRSYEDGNYLYLVDRSTDMLVHPKFWHVAGVDGSGNPVEPMKADMDEGQHPLNLLAYKTEVCAPTLIVFSTKVSRATPWIFSKVKPRRHQPSAIGSPCASEPRPVSKEWAVRSLGRGMFIGVLPQPKEKRLPYY